MQHQRARTFELGTGMAIGAGTGAGDKIASFLFILAGLIVDQYIMLEHAQHKPRMLSKSMTDELGECMIHLIKEAGKQGVSLPVIVTAYRGGRRPAVAVRYSGTSNNYWVDVFDHSADKPPLMYTILVKAADGPRRHDLNAADCCPR